MALSTEEKLEMLYTSIKLMEKEARLKDEMIAVLKEQNKLLEERITQLLSMTDSSLEQKKKG